VIWIAFNGSTLYLWPGIVAHVSIAFPELLWRKSGSLAQIACNNDFVDDILSVVGRERHPTRIYQLSTKLSFLCGSSM